jgi:hypothetical protein
MGEQKAITFQNLMDSLIQMYNNLHAVSISWLVDSLFYDFFFQ